MKTEQECKISHTFSHFCLQKVSLNKTEQQVNVHLNLDFQIEIKAKFLTQSKFIAG